MRPCLKHCPKQHQQERHQESPLNVTAFPHEVLSTIHSYPDKSRADLLKVVSSCNSHSNPRSYRVSILQCRIRRFARGSCEQGGRGKQPGRTEGITPEVHSETLNAGFDVNCHSFPAHSGPLCPLWRSFVFSSRSHPSL